MAVNAPVRECRLLTQRVFVVCSGDPTQVWDDEACKPIVSALAEISAIRTDPSLAPWLAEWRPLELYQHGALEPANIVVDVQGANWLINFSKVGMHEPFRDAGKRAVRPRRNLI